MRDRYRLNRTRCAPLVVAALLALGACGSPDPGSAGPNLTAPTGPPSPSGSASSTPAPATPSPSGAGAATAFCAELKANGATGASFGAIPVFYRKKQLLEDVDEKLSAMGDATPPPEIAKPWALQQKELREIRAAAKKLPDGGTLSDPRYGSDALLEKAQDTLTDYWFAHCG